MISTGHRNSKLCSILIACVFALFPVFYANAEDHETPPLEFVKLYVRQIGKIDSILDDAQKENEKDKANMAQTMADCVHTMTKLQIELSSQINMMQTSHLNGALSFLPQTMIDIEKQKLEFYERYGRTCTAMMEGATGGPKPGVDYGKLTSDLPKIRAFIETEDEEIFKLAPAVFMALIQQKENSHGKLDHLAINKSEKEDLIHTIDINFGTKLNAPDKNYIVSAASVLKSALEGKVYKTSDEPWE